MGAIVVVLVSEYVNSTRTHLGSLNGTHFDCFGGLLDEAAGDGVGRLQHVSAFLVADRVAEEWFRRRDQPVRNGGNPSVTEPLDDDKCD